MQIEVSIIIPTKNNQTQLNYCLESILNSEKNFTFEIIIVDDHSDKAIVVNKDNIKVIVNKNFKGPAGSRNYGSQIALGKYLFFIDSDAEVEGRALQRLYDSVSTEGIDAVFGLYSINYPYKNKNFLGEYKNLYWHFKLISLSKNTYLINTAIFAISKNLFIETGKFNEKLKVGEDIDFGERLYKKNKKVLLNKKIFFKHHKTFINFFSFIKYHFINSFKASIILKKNNTKKNIPQTVFLNFFFNFLLSFLIIFLLIYSLFDFSYFLITCLIFMIIIFYNINKRLFYLFYFERGLIFSIKSSLVYFMENLISQFAIIFSLLYKFIIIFRNKENELKR